MTSSQDQPEPGSKRPKRNGKPKVRNYVVINSALLNAAKEVGKPLHINDQKFNSSNKVPDNAKVALISCLVPT